MRFFEGYRCANCEREVPAGSIAGECPSCSGPLLGVYDLISLAAGMTREEFLSHGSGVWRFRELLPAFAGEVSLGEGNTPLVRAATLERRIDVRELYVKDESLNPTGSFKARGMAVAVSRLADLGASEARIPSAGNAALALAAYGARAGIRTRVYIPAGAPEGVASECRAYGAEVTEVEGILPDAARRMEEEPRGGRSFEVSTFREPCRVEGKKTIAFEIEGDLEGDPPDWILFPTGGGTGIVAIWKAYREMEELGWLGGPRPRMAVVQSAGCAPVVRAFESGAETVEPWDDPATVASGIQVPGSRADRQIMRALYDTGGAAVAVEDEKILEAAGVMASTEGIFPSPEGAAALAGLKELRSSGAIDQSARVVIVNTAGWSRYRFMLGAYGT